ncbi:MAG: nucleotide pyrophosphohydrolase [bacterium]|nr:nucleotide pyrophosphohydrolase [bacterium]
MLHSGGSTHRSCVDDCALRQAFALQTEASELGFDWPDIAGVLAKVREETDEVVEDIERGDRAAAGREVGDLLFSAVNLARFLDVDPRDVLLETNSKFTSRFECVKAEVAQSGRAMAEYTLDELDEVWERVKSYRSNPASDS